MAKDKHPGGRPTKYSKKYNAMVYKLALLNLTDKEIADVLGIAKSTFYEWKKEYPEFSDSVLKGGRIADADLASSLYKKGKGFSYVEVRDEFECQRTESGDPIPGTEAKVKTVKTKKTVPPDTGAIALWLGNRTRKNDNKWSTRPDNVKGDDNNDKAERAAQIIKELLGED